MVLIFPTPQSSDYRARKQTFTGKTSGPEIAQSSHCEKSTGQQHVATSESYDDTGSSSKVFEVFLFFCYKVWIGLISQALRCFKSFVTFFSMENS